MPRHIIMDASGHTTIKFDTASLTDLAEAKSVSQACRRKILIGPFGIHKLRNKSL